MQLIAFTMLLIINKSYACDTHLEELTCTVPCPTYDDFIDLYKSGDESYLFFKCDSRLIKYSIIDTTEPEETRIFYFDEYENMVGKIYGDTCYGSIYCNNSQSVYPYLEDSGDSGGGEDSPAPPSPPPPDDPTCGCATPALPALSLALLPCLLLTRRARRSV